MSGMFWMLPRAALRREPPMSWFRRIMALSAACSALTVERAIEAPGHLLQACQRGVGRPRNGRRGRSPVRGHAGRMMEG
jgi:hypothetical protein